ncbi:putative membrane protein, partial [Yersinia pestis PY-66]
ALFNLKPIKMAILFIIIITFYYYFLLVTLDFTF